VGTAQISLQTKVDTINAFIKNPRVQSLQVRGELTGLVFVCILPIFMVIGFALFVGGGKSLWADLIGWVNEKRLASPCNK